MLSNLFGLGWVWCHGWLAAYLSSAFISPLGMGFLILFVEARPLHLREQYFSFIIGNSAALAPIVATTSLMVGTLPPGNHWWTSDTWMITCFVIACLIGPAQALMEYLDHAYTAAQFKSPAKAYHNTLVYMVLGFWILSGTIPAIACSKDGFGGTRFGWPPSHWHIHAPSWQFYLVMAAFALFGAMVVYDSMPKHRKPNAHVAFSWRLFWRGKDQAYQVGHLVWWEKVFPPQIALPLFVAVAIVSYLLLKM